MRFDRTRIWLWLATAAVAGAIVMALELVSFRLYAPYFGYSIYVWGSMISVVMAALALGYGLGGWIADRTQTDVPVYASALASALYQLLMLGAVYSFLPSLAQLGDFIGTILATSIIFAVPMTLLATMPPVVIRLLARAGHIGAAAGRVYGVSTAGSMGGILLTSFLLLPRFGTRLTLQVLCAVSLLLGVCGLAAAKRRALAALFLLPLVLLAPEALWPRDTVWVRESAYNLLRVAQQGHRRILYLNNNAAQTVQAEPAAGTGFYYDQFALGPLLVPARRALALGMGAAASIRAARSTAPEIEFDAVEIDPKVVEAAVEWFGLRLQDPRLHVHVADARRWLAKDVHRYDLIQEDVYQGGPYVPFYLVTEEFFRLVRAHMTDDALLMTNLFDIGADRQLLFAAAATLRRVFPSVMVRSDIHGNHILFAFVRPRSVESVRSTLEQARTGLAGSTAALIADLAPPVDTRVFTDDLAPVEEMTRSMLRGSGSADPTFRTRR
ncbi:MAG TPA: fused MFS/spermidine synthase [Bryobacteraceae bacterium]|nr:fused MFS/spermidine synthase [Bryobacteraceae bacterium]